jgi:hypothetical protein
MKHLMLLKTEAMKRFTLHCLASLFHRFTIINTTVYDFMQKSPDNSCKNLQHICKSKDNKVFRLCYGNYRNVMIFANANHRFFALIFFVKA